MTKATDISAGISREVLRRNELAAAARAASLEVASKRDAQSGFCDIAYIVGAMEEAAAKFDARN